MNKTLKILLLVLLAWVVVHSIAVGYLYWRDAERAKNAPLLKSQTCSWDRDTIDPKVLKKIHQLDAANVAADVQGFHKQHPSSKIAAQLDLGTGDGLAREFDRTMISADVPALSRICKQISEDPFSGVTIKTITDNPQICGITRVERPSERDESSAEIPRWIAIYEYDMADSRQKPFGGMSYLAVSWSKKSGAWALESAITTGSFFKIEKKP